MEIGKLVVERHCSTQIVLSTYLIMSESVKSNFFQMKSGWVKLVVMTKLLLDAPWNGADWGPAYAGANSST